MRRTWDTIVLTSFFIFQIDVLWLSEEAFDIFHPFCYVQDFEKNRIVFLKLLSHKLSGCCETSSSTFDCIDCLGFECVLITLKDGLVTNSSLQVRLFVCDGKDTERVLRFPVQMLPMHACSMHSRSKTNSTHTAMQISSQTTRSILPAGRDPNPHVLLHQASFIIPVLRSMHPLRPELDKPGVAAPFTRSPQSCCWWQSTDVAAGSAGCGQMSARSLAPRWCCASCVCAGGPAFLWSPSPSACRGWRWCSSQKLVGGSCGPWCFWTCVRSAFGRAARGCKGWWAPAPDSPSAWEECLSLPGRIGAVC